MTVQQALEPLRWYKVADNIEAISWNTDDLAVAHVGGRRIMLARLNGSVYACIDRCPHASGYLSQGFLDGSGNIVCPLHKYRFNLNNGHNVSGEGYRLKIFAVEKREAGIFVGIQEQGLDSMPEIM